MHGSGTFFDARLSSQDQYPVAARSGSGNTRGVPDRLTAKLAALHFYQLSIPAPKALAGSFSAAAASRGKALFDGRARCASCHVPPLFTEPGNNLHAPAEIGVDAFRRTGRLRTCTAPRRWRGSRPTRRETEST